MLLGALVASTPVPLGAQGYNLLVGGGSHDDDCDLADGHWSDAVYDWLVVRAAAAARVPNGGNGKILSLDYETFAECGVDDPPNQVGECAYFECLGAAEVDHVCVTAAGGGGCLAADDPATKTLIVGYDGLWFCGGDQSSYVDNWKDTETEAGIFEVWQSGCVLGGTSAGAMMQYGFVFDLVDRQIDVVPPSEAAVPPGPFPTAFGAAVFEGATEEDVEKRLQPVTESFPPRTLPPFTWRYIVPRPKPAQTQDA